MEFLALIHGSDDGWNELSDDDDHGPVRELHIALEFVGGAELQETNTATTVRVRNGDSMVTDGPYAEVKESLGGFFILEANSIDDACKLAAEIPAAEHGAIEVRPVVVREES